jgi:trans-2,3-dihydro-3-hydroxyanthranilate isomerase
VRVRGRYLMTMKTYRYRVVDVFTEKRLEGNPLAVFPEASGLDDETMQRIANELNLAETVFAFPASQAGHDARVRIFTPRREMPFAGHPTIGVTFVLIDEGLVTARQGGIVLQEKIGPVAVRVDEGEQPLIWLSTPPIRSGPVFDRLLCAEALGVAADDLLDIPPQLLDAGNPTVFIPLRSRDAVDRAWIDERLTRALLGSDATPACVFVFTPTAEGAYSRMFAPEYGVIEDPATGSSTGPLAAFMMRHGLVSSASGTRFVSEQGRKMGRRSLLHVRINGAQGSEGIEVGGHVVPVTVASMTVD